MHRTPLLPQSVRMTARRLLDLFDQGSCVGKVDGVPMQPVCPQAEHGSPAMWLLCASRLRAERAPPRPFRDAVRCLHDDWPRDACGAFIYDRYTYECALTFLRDSDQAKRATLDTTPVFAKVRPITQIQMKHRLQHICRWNGKTFSTAFTVSVGLRNRAILNDAGCVSPADRMASAP